VNNQSQAVKRLRKPRKSSSKSQKLADVTRLYGDIMSVVEHNGHVALPPLPFFKTFLTSRHIRAFGFCVAILGAVALLKLSRRV
jgi:hypothetical protein